MDLLLDFLVHLFGLAYFVVIWGGIFAVIAWVLRQLRSDTKTANTDNAKANANSE